MSLSGLYPQKKINALTVHKTLYGYLSAGYRFRVKQSRREIRLHISFPERAIVTLAAGTAEAYRSAARNEQPWRGSVISPMPAWTAYARYIHSVLSLNQPGTESRAARPKISHPVRHMASLLFMAASLPLARLIHLNNTVHINSKIRGGILCAISTEFLQ